ncbi:MAG: nuclear transport factor 2 family protein [Acidobacteriota bacterium]
MLKRDNELTESCQPRRRSPRILWASLNGLRRLMVERLGWRSPKARRSIGAVLIGAAAVMPVHAQSGRGGGPDLTAQDRVEIQDLVTRYARALAGCAAEEYADLFAPGGGYFFSSIRGEVGTRERLIGLVKSERQCNPTANANPNANANAAGRGGPANAAPAARAAGGATGGPVVTLESTPEGIKGIALLGNAGGYEDTYVKTPNGWRFKARSVITGQEAAAKLTAQDFAEIRRLAGNDRGEFDDVYVDTPNGKRFRSSGVAFALVPDGVKGTAYLRNDGGRYDDVYVKTANGWRFKSRVYVPPAEPK